MSGENTWDFYAMGASEWLKANPTRPTNQLTFAYPSDLEMLRLFRANGLVLTRQGYERLEQLESREG